MASFFKKTNSHALVYLSRREISLLASLNNNGVFVVVATDDDDDDDCWFRRLVV